MKLRIISQGFKPHIFKSNTVLYIGIIAFQPSSPAFSKIFHMGKMLIKKIRAVHTEYTDNSASFGKKELKLKVKSKKDEFIKTPPYNI